MLQLLAAPTLRQMLVAAKHMRAAASAVESVRSDVCTIAQACSDVQNSETLRKVLRYTLSMGNFLNSGSKDACAAAFHVEDLLKLKEVKGSGGASGCKSLLHFLAKQLLQVLLIKSTLLMLVPLVPLCQSTCMGHERMRIHVNPVCLGVFQQTSQSVFQRVAT